MSLSGVIFDMDGVIFDSEIIWKEAFEIANKKFNVSFTEEYRQTWCGRDENSIREELRRIEGFAADNYRDFIISFVESKINENGAPLKEGFCGLAAYLKGNGFKLALATSNKKSRAVTQFSKAGLDMQSIFDFAVFGESVKVSKPNPEIFLLAANGMNVPPENCYVLEDSLNGIEAAVNGGFKPIMVIDLIPPKEKQKRDCLFIADNLAGVEKYFHKKEN